MAEPRYSAQETVQRGEEWYEREIRARVEPEHRGKYLVLDIETGKYEIGTEYHPLAQRMLVQKPDAALCVLRIGYPVAGRIGGRFRAASR